MYWACMLNNVKSGLLEMQVAICFLLEGVLALLCV